MQASASGLGVQLRRAGEARGLTLAEVSAATKISERVLQAIERAYREHFEDLEVTGDHDESADWPRPALAIAVATMLAAMLGLAVVAFA